MTRRSEADHRRWIEEFTEFNRRESRAAIERQEAERVRAAADAVYALCIEAERYAGPAAAHAYRVIEEAMNEHCDDLEVVKRDPDNPSTVYINLDAGMEIPLRRSAWTAEQARVLAEIRREEHSVLTELAAKLDERASVSEAAVKRIRAGRTTPSGSAEQR